MTTLAIPAALVVQLSSHGERTYPEECCGVLLGTEKSGARRVEALVELANSMEGDRARRFLVTPQQYLQAEEEARSAGLLLLGFYHSHPDHPAVPSRFDLEHAWPWFTYLIQAVERGKAGKFGAWSLGGGARAFEPCTIEID